MNSLALAQATEARMASAFLGFFTECWGSGAGMCLSGDRVMAARCLSWVWRWGGDRAPPARRSI